MGKTSKAHKPWAGTTKQTRLRIDEGLVRHPDERGLRTLDRSGQKLRDVIDPKTGFCVGVTSPMESDGRAVYEASPVSGGGAPLPELDPDTGLWWVGIDRLVVRTVQTPDGPLRRARLIKADNVGRSGSPTPNGGRVDKSARRTGRRSFTDAEIKAWVKAFCGFSGTLTRQMRRAAVDAMIKAQVVADYERSME